MKRLLAKSYDRRKHGDEPPDYALLTQHSRDVATACDALADAVGRVALQNAELDEEMFEQFRLELRADGWIQDLGKANSHFQEMVQGSPEVKQLLRHETISGLLMSSPEFPFRNWLLDRLSETSLLAALWGALGHHRKFDKYTKPTEATLPLRVHVSHPDFRVILDEMSRDLGLQPPPTLAGDLVVARRRKEKCDVAAPDAIEDLQMGFEERETAFAGEKARRRLALVKALGIAADVAASAVAARAQSAEKYSLRDFVRASVSVGLRPDDLSSLISHWAWSRSACGEPTSNRSEWPPDITAREFQMAVAQSEAHLTLAQAGCGSGKSLAAYMWAREWSRRFEREGRRNFRLFFCLPTTGTTTEHFKDYALESGLPPHLMSLTHSRASVDLRAIAETAPQEEADENDRDPASIAQAALNAERNKIESLALWSTPLAVTTADTVLGLMANARRSIYSIPALMSGAIVFDEVHAFDERMFGHLLVFLKNFPKLPVLLMTASLPEERKRAIESVRPSLKIIPGPPEFEELERYVVREAGDVEEVWREVKACLQAKGKVLWVRNRVDWANKTYAECRDKHKDITVNVYHSRLRYKDRAVRHRRVIDEFKRSESGTILVATQVAEMSLDLSADLLVTDIAPIPSLIQRMGRLNRRLTPDTPPGERQAKIALVCPLPKGEPKAEMPYTPEELNEAREWGTRLRDLGRALSQRDLADTFAQFSRGQEFDVTRAEELACFFSGLWQTRPGLTRGEGHTISVIWKPDLDAWLKQNPSAEPPRDWLRQHEVAIPIKEEALKWGRVGGLRVAPSEMVEYDYDETTQEGTGAKWRNRR